MTNNMKAIAIIASCDTKSKEVVFMQECIRNNGCRPFVIDISIGLEDPIIKADMGREKVVENVGVSWNDVKDNTKAELIIIMQNAVKVAVLRMYAQKRISGIVSVGGVQNTYVAVSAMLALPIGFPKVMATTIASGRREFDSVVGDKDIVVIPSISDFTGLNLITRSIMLSACACVCGMAQNAGAVPKKTGRIVVGVTLMGVVNKGACAAINELERLGLEAVGFHSTGVGGGIMEDLACQGIIDAVLDLSTHEITSEYFGGGFSYSPNSRLLKITELGIPLVITPGALDFVDFARSEFPHDIDIRKYNMHNGELAHIKILPHEAKEVGRILAERLNRAKNGAVFLIPTDGMRQNGRHGEALYDQETDEALISAVINNINDRVVVRKIEGNLNEEEWGKQAARQMYDLLESKGR